MKAKIQILVDNEIKYITLSELYEELRRQSSNYNQLEKDQESKLLTRVQVCERLHITLPTIYSWTKKGLLKPVKVGSRVLFREDDIKELLKS